MPKQNKTLKIPKVYIISGIYKGMGLSLPPMQTTRSSKSRLKESLFNTLGSEVVNTTFVEFFAGSGSIGLEALSRGAKEVYFFEKDKIAFEVLQKNITHLKALSTTKAFLGDTFSIALNTLHSINSPSIGYFDPPFSIRENMQNIYLKTTALISQLKECFFCVILEHESSFTPPLECGLYTLTKNKTFGKSTLSYYHRNKT